MQPLLDADLVTHEADRTAVTSLDAQVGRRIQLARRQRGVTQDDLARAIGVSFQQLQRYERGATPVSAKVLVRLAGALGCNADRLLPSFPEPEAEPDRPSPPPSADADMLNDTAELVRAFLAISNRDDRQRVLGLAVSLGADAR